MAIELESLAWGLLGVLAIWAIAKICIAAFGSATQQERLRLRHLETLALAREETIRFQTFVRPGGLQAGDTKVYPKTSHPAPPPTPDRHAHPGERP